MSHFAEIEQLLDQCLNPYYIGSYSMSIHPVQVETVCWSLNPYYIGSYSMSLLKTSSNDSFFRVLILIILEVTLWDRLVFSKWQACGVLILIILEVTLWGDKRYAQILSCTVLILIILEVTLWEASRFPSTLKFRS